LFFVLLAAVFFSILENLLKVCCMPISIAGWLEPLFAVPGMVMVFSAAMLFSRHGCTVNRFLALLGARSLEIFVAHVIFLAGLRVGLLKLFHTSELSVHLIGATIVGIVGPLMLAFAVERFRFRSVFTWSRSI
jgi:uncharacterized membrane protein YcfT